MLTAEDLQAIGKLLDQKMDERFSEAETKQDTRFLHMENKLDKKLDTRFLDMDNKMDEKLDVRFSESEKKIDEKLNIRFFEVEKRMDQQMNVRFSGMEYKIDTKFKTELDPIQKDIRKIYRELKLLRVDLNVTIRAFDREIIDHRERIETIESNLHMTS